MAAKTMSVKLHQWRNPKWATPEELDAWCKGLDPDSEARYRAAAALLSQWHYTVVELRNRLEPAVGSVITPSAVEALIRGGVEVSIQQPK